MHLSRRRFLEAALLSSASFALPGQGHQSMSGMSHMDHGHPRPQRPAIPRTPAVLCKVTGTAGIDEAYNMLASEGDTLEAALHICTTQENDPSDHSAGLGGLPTSAGTVELDACCFEGATGRAAAIRCVRGIRNAALLARTLMQTGKPTLLGEAARSFALLHGFPEEDLLTTYSAECYSLWQMLRANNVPSSSGHMDTRPAAKLETPDFLPQSKEELLSLIRLAEPAAVRIGIPSTLSWRASVDSLSPSAAPVFASCVGKGGDLSCASTSSGQPWRKTNLYSDAGVVGAGCFVDNAVGSAGASGNAEENIQVAGARRIVENMRGGMAPEAAGLDVLRRVVALHRRDPSRLRRIDLTYYILRKDGAYSAVSLWAFDRTGQRHQYVVKDGPDTRRTEDCVALLQGNPLDFRGSISSTS